MNLVRLHASTFHLLDSLERTPGHREQWVAEVEEFLLGPAVGTHLDEPRSLILFAGEDGTAIGAALCYPSSTLLGAQYIGAMLVDHRVRGKGYGRALLVETIKFALESSQRPYVVWAVHPENVAMRRLSESVGEFHNTEPSGYLAFVYPPD